MKRAYWALGVLIAAIIALYTYGLFFDSNKSLSHVLGMMSVRVVLFLLTLWFAVSVRYTMDFNKRKFTQEEVSDILAEAKRSGKQ